MLKKTLSVFLCFLLCLSCAAVPAFASVTLMNAAEDIDHVQFIDDDNITGTVYISISDDGRFVTSDGIESGHVMAYIAVPISELAFDLTDWGYNGFIFDLGRYDNEAAYRQPITVMHLLIYTLEKYYSDGWQCNVTGGAGSTYIQNGFWGHDENLTYYVNGKYPLDGEGWGATSDHICLEDGDYVDLQMYSSWNFWMDSAAGYHYFLDKNEKITHSYTVTAGKSFTPMIGRAWGSLAIGGATNMEIEEDYTFCYGTELYGDDYTEACIGDAISFDAPGTYYLWVDGSYGEENPDDIVSSPAYAKVTVNAAAHTHSFTKKIISDDYLKSPATCTAKATYFYACKDCGAKGTNTYTYGNTIAHTFTKKTATADYLNTPATCTAKATYFYACSKCGAKGTTTYEYGNTAAHTFTKKTATADYLNTPATCTKKATYFYACSKCGAKGTTTYEYGNTAAHAFTKKTATADYLNTPATCTAKATYFYACKNCGAKGTATYEYGNTAAHAFTKKTATADYLNTPATCTAKATYFYACKNCGAKGTATYEYGEPAGHTAPNAEGKCDTCGVVLTETPESQEADLCPYCGQPHTGAFGSIIRFFHNLIYFFQNLFGKK